MQVSEILEMKKGIKSKLMAATSLLLVSAILLSLTTYAWFILSTAPEVTEMQTTAGANGALEIALQTGDTVGEILDSVGSSSAVGTLKNANSTWGNVVDLSGNTYGLEGLSLLPARLNINADGVVSKTSPLVMPVYGQDGRISSLANLNSMYWNDKTYEKIAGSSMHGVLVYTDDESVKNGSKDEKTLNRQSLIDTTRQQILELRTSLRQDLVDTMDKNQAGISSILYHTVSLSDGGNGSDTGGRVLPKDNNAKYGVEDYKCILRLLSSFSDIQAKSAKSVRCALLACAAADTLNYPMDETTNISEKLSDLYAKFLTLPIGSKNDDEEETVYKIAAKNKAELEKQNPENTELIDAYASVMSAANATTDVQTRIQSAQKGLENSDVVDLAAKDSSMTSDEQSQFSREISNSILSLFEIDAAINRGIYVTDETDSSKLPRTLWNEMSSTTGKYYNSSTTTKPSTCGTRFYMLKDSGLFSSLAALAGDFESKSILGEQKGPKGRIFYYLTQIRASTAARPTQDNLPWGYEFGYSPETNTGCLQAVYNATSGLKADGSVKYVITTVDKVNAYGYSIDLAFRSSESDKLILQQNAVDRVTGEESDTPEGRLPSTSTTQGNGSTVELWLRKSTQEYLEDASAAERARELVKCLRVAFLVDNGDWNILCVAMVDEDNDSIKFTDFASSETVKVTANLYIYSASTMGGKLSLSKAANQSITDLIQDTPKAITALVYLDGDEVQNAFLTPDQPFTLSGSVNLQFATEKKTLKPMEYADFVKKEEEKEDETTGN